MSGQQPWTPRIAEPFIIDRILPSPFIPNTAPAQLATLTFEVITSHLPSTSIVIDRFLAPVPLTSTPTVQPNPVVLFPFVATSIQPNTTDVATTAPNDGPTMWTWNTTSPKNLTENVALFNFSFVPAMTSELSKSSYFTTVSSATTNDEQFLSNLCGLPSFCSPNTAQRCANVSLIECQDCSMGAASIFAAAIILLGLLIVLGNGFVIWCNAANKSGFTGGYNKIKASLAVADLLTGLQIFCISIYNFSWTINATANELNEHQWELRGSPQATVGGIFYFLGFTSSLYHLIFLSQQRFRAIKWPILYKSQGGKVIYIGLAVVWILAILMSVLPTFFQNTYVYTYMQTTFLFNLTLKEVQDQPYSTPLMLMFLAVFIIPYIVMSGLTIGSGVVLHSYRKRSKDISQSIHGQRVNKHEVYVYKMLAIMQCGFTVTLVPLVVVVLLSYTNVLTCQTISAPFAVCIYLSMSNSLVNVLVYGFMDKNFRNAIRESLLCCLEKKFFVTQPSSSENAPQKECTTKSTPVTVRASHCV